MAEAGGRLFVDVTSGWPRRRAATACWRPGRSDPLTGDALRTVLERDGFIAAPRRGPPGPLFGNPSAPIETDRPSSST